MFQLARAFARALWPPPIAPSALSDNRSVGAALRAAFGGASGRGLRGGLSQRLLDVVPKQFWAIPGRLGLGFEVVELKFEVWGLGSILGVILASPI